MDRNAACQGSLAVMSTSPGAYSSEVMLPLHVQLEVGPFVPSHYPDNVIMKWITQYSCTNPEMLVGCLEQGHISDS